MAENSRIEWTDHTWNPWWGCVKISEACTHCYAATYANRYGVAWGPKARRRFFGEKHWNEPVTWNRRAEKAGKRARVFCASMADVFEELPAAHPDQQAMFEARNRLWDLIHETPALDWLLLTKRPENIRGLVPPGWWGSGFPQNVWAGVTAEDQKHADERIPVLLSVPARVLFLSCEPLVGAIDLRHLQPEDPPVEIDCLAGTHGVLRPHQGRGRSVDWVIVGGESGPGARPMYPGWVRKIRDDCADTKTACFVKQWGDWLPADQLRADGMHSQLWEAGLEAFGGTADLRHEWPDGTRSHRVGKKAAGRYLDGRTWDEFPAGVEAR